MILRIVAVAAVLLLHQQHFALASRAFEPRFKSPLRSMKIEAATLSESWAISGTHWFRHVWRSYDEPALLSTIQFISPEEKKLSDDAGANLPKPGRLSFSTCEDSPSSALNFLQSPMFENAHLPRHRLPAVVKLDVLLYVSETCIKARRPTCLRGLDIWLSEAESSRSPVTFSHRLVFTGSRLAADTSDSVKRVGKMLWLSMSFRVNRTPFQIKVQDARGACLEVRAVQMEATSCSIAKAVSGPIFRLVTTTTPRPDTSYYYAENDTLSLNPALQHSLILEFKSHRQLLSELDCLCPAGFSVTDEGINCVSCPPQTFTPTPHHLDNCTVCPDNSVAPEPESTLCTCLDNTWRVPSEGPGAACGMPPSAPQSYDVIYLDTHSTIVNWSAPANLGNRTDLTYQVTCLAGCKDIGMRRDWEAAGADQSVIVSLDDIWTNIARRVTIRIYSMNGISSVAGSQYSKYIEAVLTLPRSLNHTEDAVLADSEPNIFTIFIDIVGPLGALSIVVGVVVLSCFLFCLIRMWQEPELWRRTKPRVKILGTSSSSPSAADSTEDDALNAHSSNESLRSHSKSRAAEFLLNIERNARQRSSDSDFFVPSRRNRVPLLPSVAMRMAMPRIRTADFSDSQFMSERPPLIDDPTAEDYQSFIGSDSMVTNSNSKDKYYTPPTGMRRPPLYQQPAQFRSTVQMPVTYTPIEYQQRLSYQDLANRQNPYLATLPRPSYYRAQHRPTSQHIWH